MARKKHDPASNELMKHLLENYEINSSLDIQEALKDIFSETLESILESELDQHLG